MALPLSLCVLGYLLGSIPFGLCMGRLRGVDLRQTGSGNIGATNAMRALGKKLGLLVFLLDFAKGLLPVMLMQALVDPPLLWPLICAMVAIAGHVYPVYLRFHGGKGVATSAGAFVGLEPMVTAIAIGVWILTLGVSRLVALASVLSLWSFPVALIVLGKTQLNSERATIGLGLLLAVLITWRHRSNLQRMVRGEEPRVGKKPSHE